MSGYEICRTLRRLDTEIPAPALTARTLSEDKIAAFDCGVDQYMTKPFSLPELLSRVRNLLDRRRRNLERRSVRPTNDVVRFGDVIADFGRFEIRHKDEVHTMTTREQELLRYFLENDGVVLSRARLQSDVWKDSADISSRSVDNFVMRLRRMIEAVLLHHVTCCPFEEPDIALFASPPQTPRIQPVVQRTNSQSIRSAGFSRHTTVESDTNSG